MKKEKSCGCIVINDGKVLLVRHNKGHWDFPKGHVEPGETEEQTAKREVKEETNIDVEINTNFRYLNNYIIEEKQIEKDVVLFVAKPISLDVKPQEIEVNVVEWIDINEALELITHTNSKNILKKAIEDLNI